VARTGALSGEQVFEAAGRRIDLALQESFLGFEAGHALPQCLILLAQPCAEFGDLADATFEREQFRFHAGDLIRIHATGQALPISQARSW
jgi:hypothetical protein